MIYTILLSYSLYYSLFYFYLDKSLLKYLYLNLDNFSLSLNKYFLVSRTRH